MNTQWKIFIPAIAIIIVAAFFVAYRASVTTPEKTSLNTPAVIAKKISSSPTPSSQPTATPIPSTNVNLNSVPVSDDPDQAVNTLLQAGTDTGIDSELNSTNLTDTSTDDQQASSEKDLVTQE